jgi:glycosyltransferase involved in cell wall biosynthesis
MAAGRPTVAAALGQIAEVIDHRNTGWLYPAGDWQRLAEGIATLLTDRDLAGKIGEAGRRAVLENYTWKIVAGKVLEIYRRIAKQRAPQLT